MKNINGFAAPEPTSYALGRLGLTSIKPNTIPITGLPPKFLNVDQHTSAGRNANAVSVNTCVNVSKFAGTLLVVKPKDAR